MTGEVIPKATWDEIYEGRRHQFQVGKHAYGGGAGRRGGGARGGGGNKTLLGG